MMVVMTHIVTQNVAYVKENFVFRVSIYFTLRSYLISKAIQHIDAYICVTCAKRVKKLYTETNL